MMSYKSVDRDLDHSKPQTTNETRSSRLVHHHCGFKKSPLPVMHELPPYRWSMFILSTLSKTHTHKHRASQMVCTLNTHTAFLLLHSHFKWKPGSVCCGSPLLSAFLWLDFDSTGFVRLTLPERLRLQAGEWLLLCTNVSVFEGSCTCWHIYSSWYVLGFHIY